MPRLTSEERMPAADFFEQGIQNVESSDGSLVAYTSLCFNGGSDFIPQHVKLLWGEQSQLEQCMSNEDCSALIFALVDMLEYRVEIRTWCVSRPCLNAQLERQLFQES